MTVLLKTNLSHVTKKGPKIWATFDYSVNLSLMYNEITFLQGFTDDQLVLVEQNTVLVEEREREIRQIVQSISDLNEIFRDLAGMVVEQVTDAYQFVS